MDCICSDEIPTDVRESPRKSDRRAWPVCGISAPERPHYSRYGRLSTGCRLSETSKRRDGEHMGFSELSPAHSCRLELKWTAVASTESGVLRMLNPFRHHCSAEPCSEKHYESSAIHCPLCMAWPTSRLAFFHFGKGNMWNGPLARKSSDVLPYRSFHSMYYTRLGVQHQITRPLTMKDTYICRSLSLEFFFFPVLQHILLYYLTICLLTWLFASRWVTENAENEVSCTECY